MGNERKANLAALKRALIEATGPGKKWTRRSLSIKVGGPDVVRDIISGKSKNPKSETILGIARELNINPAELFGEPAEPSSSVTVIGAVQAGVWREREAWPEDQHFTVSAGTELPEPDAEKFGLVVEGRSMDRTFPPGTVLFVARVFGSDLAPQDGDYVIVRRQRSGLYETTCKRLEGDSERGFVLHCESYLPEFGEPIDIGRPSEEHDSDDDIEIVGIVVGAYTNHYRRK